MGIINDVNAPAQTLPNRGQKLISNLAATTLTAPAAAGSTSAEAGKDLTVGSKYAGGIIVNIDPEQGYRVRAPDGTEKYIPADVSEKLLPYLNDDGSLDVLAAVKAGLTKPSDFAGWNVTDDSIKQAQNYIVNKQYGEIEASAAKKLAPYVKADGSLDLLAAVKAGLTSPNDYAGWNVTDDSLQKAQSYLKKQSVSAELEKYKASTGEGYDVYKAIKDDVSKDTLQSAFDLTDAEYQDYKLTAPFISYDNSGNPSVDLPEAMKALNAASGEGKANLASALSKQFDLSLETAQGTYTLKPRSNPETPLKSQPVTFKPPAAGDSQALFKKLYPDATPVTAEEYHGLARGRTEPDVIGYLITLDTVEGAAARVQLAQKAAGQEVMTLDDIITQMTPSENESPESQQARHDTFKEFFISQDTMPKMGYQPKAIESTPSTERELPAGISSEQVTQIAQRAADSDKQALALNKQADDAQKAWQTYAQSIRDAHPNEPYTLTDEEAKKSGDLEAEFYKLSKQAQAFYSYKNALKSYSDFFEVYRGNPDAQFDELPTADDVAKLLSGTDPDTVPYITSDQSNRAGYDLIGARAAGLSDVKLKTLGFTEDDLRVADAYVAIQKVLPKGVNDYDDISVADEAGLSSQLGQIGVTDEDLRMARSLKAVKAVLPDGLTDYDSILKAKEAGLEDDLKTLGVTNADLDAADALGRLREAGLVDANGGVTDVLAAQRMGLSSELKAIGYGQATIDEAKAVNADQAAWYASHTKVDGQYFTNTDLDILKKSDPELYDTLLTKGLDAYNAEYQYKLNQYDNIIHPKGGHEITAEMDALEPYKQGTGYDIAGYLKANKDIKNAIQTLQAMGFSGTAINQAVSYNAAVVKVGSLSPNAYLLANPADTRTLSDLGLSSQAIAKIQTDNKGRSPNAGDYVVSFVHNKMPDIPDEDIRVLSGLASANNRGFFPDSYPILQKYQSKNGEGTAEGKAIGQAIYDALKEYRAKYGTGNALLSEAAPLAGTLVSPARAIAPDVLAKDIGGMEWAIGGAQVALLAVPIMPKGLGALAGAGATGIFIADQAKSWHKMSTTSKAVSIGTDLLCLLPTLGYAGSKVKVATVEVDTSLGKVKVYKGLTFNDNPVIGKSGKEWIVGNETDHIVYPDKATLSLSEHYEPVTKLETKIMANREALHKMGWTDDEIARMENTLITTKSLTGLAPKLAALRSRISPEMIDAAPIKSLSKDGVAAVFDSALKLKDKVKTIYGSFTLKQQLASDLKNWRELGDLDVMTSFDKEGAAKYAQDLVAELEKTEGVGKVRVSANRATLIETQLPDGTWDHAVDIHTFDEPQLDINGQPLPESPTGRAQGAYGMDFAEPTIKVKYADGTLEFMNIAETGKRKMASILEWNAPAGTQAAAKAQAITDEIAQRYGLTSTQASKIWDKVLYDQGTAGFYNQASGKIGLLDLPKYSVQVEAKNVQTIVHELVHSNFEDLITKDPAFMDKLDQAVKDMLADPKAKLAGTEQEARALIEKNYEEIATIGITKQLTGLDNAAYREALTKELKDMLGSKYSKEISDLAQEMADNVKLPAGERPNAEAVAKTIVKQAGKDLKLTFAPPAYRTKDISDLYVIIRTLKGQATADSWAKVYGYNIDDLLAIQERDPLKLSKWLWKPENYGVSTPSSKGASRAAAAPTISIVLPKDLPHSKAASPAIVARANAAVTSPMILAQTSPEAAAKLKTAMQASPSLSGKNLPSKPAYSSPPSRSASQPASKGVSKPSSKSPSSKPSSVPPSKPASPASSKPVSVKPSSPPVSKAISKALSKPPSSPALSKVSSPASSKPASSKASSPPSSKPPSSKPSSKPPSKPPSSPPYSPATYSPSYKPPYSPKYSPPPYKPNYSPPSSPPYKPPYYKPPYSPPSSPPSHHPTESFPNKPVDVAAGKKTKKGTGVYTWRQGAFWTRRIFRPESKGGVIEIWQRKPFDDAPKDKRLPNETFYVGGKEDIPANYREQMGAVNVRISPTGYPILRYKGRKSRL